MSFAEVERQAILDALQSSEGKIYGARGAAAILKLKPTTLYGKMRKHRITRQRGGFEPDSPAGSSRAKPSWQCFGMHINRKQFLGD